MQKNVAEKEKDIIVKINKFINKNQQTINAITERHDLTSIEKGGEIAKLQKEIEDSKHNSNTQITKLNLDAFQKQQELEEKYDLVRGTNWDQENITTINNWIIECNKQEYVYDFVP